MAPRTRIPKKGVDYKVVTKKHQMDQNGKLFVSSAWNIRGQTTQDREMGINTPLDPQAVGYATQYDFDKYCFDNPDSRYPFDWNAARYFQKHTNTRILALAQGYI